MPSKSVAAANPDQHETQLINIMEVPTPEMETKRSGIWIPKHAGEIRSETGCKLMWLMNKARKTYLPSLKSHEFGILMSCPVAVGVQGMPRTWRRQLSLPQSPSAAPKEA